MRNQLSASVQLIRRGCESLSTFFDTVGVDATGSHFPNCVTSDHWGRSQIEKPIPTDDGERAAVPTDTVLQYLSKLHG